MPQITAQLDYALGKGWAIGIEYTDDPHPRNTYWEMFGNPMFDLHDAAGVLMEINHCRKTFPSHYIRVTAFDATRGVESPTMSYIVNRPARTNRALAWCVRKWTAAAIRYTIHSYATDKSEGERY